MPTERVKPTRPTPRTDDEMAARFRGAHNANPSVASLEQAMQIDPNALDEALMQQPDAYYRVAQRLALVISQRDAAKQGLQELEAEVDRDLRKDAAKAEEKLSEAQIKSLTRLDPDVKEAERAMLNLNRDVAQWQALKEGFQQRSYVLKDLVALHVTGYFGDNTNNRAVNAAKERTAENVRREQQAERETRTSNRRSER